MSPWGWQPRRTQGVWRYGAPWIRPVLAAVPFLTVCLLLVMMLYLNGKFMLADGTAFELPSATVGEGVQTELVALVMRMPRETLVFFDDSRYRLDDAASRHAFREHLKMRLEHGSEKTMLVLADRQVATGELLELMSLIRESGATKVLLAEKHGGNLE